MSDERFEQYLDKHFEKLELKLLTEELGLFTIEFQPPTIVHTYQLSMPYTNFDTLTFFTSRQVDPANPVVKSIHRSKRSILEVLIRLIELMSDLYKTTDERATTIIREKLNSLIIRWILLTLVHNVYPSENLKFYSPEKLQMSSAEEQFYHKLAKNLAEACN